MTSDIHNAVNNGISHANAYFQAKTGAPQATNPIGANKSVFSAFAYNAQQLMEDTYQSSVSKKAEALYERFNEAKDKQGIIGKTWDGIKNLTGFGASSDKARQAISSWQKGEISFEEANEQINQYDVKQKDAVDLITNIGSGIAVAIGAATGGLGLAAGALLGASVKAGAKFLDRATNEIDDDALDMKQIAKDGVTGALDGAVTIATGGLYKASAVAGNTVGQAVKEGAIQGLKQGAAAGALMGAGTYTTEAVFEEDAGFTFEGLAGSTVEGALAGAVTGAVMGGISNGIAQKNLNAKTTSEQLPPPNEPNEPIGGKKEPIGDKEPIGGGKTNDTPPSDPAGLNQPKESLGEGGGGAKKTSGEPKTDTNPTGEGNTGGEANTGSAKQGLGEGQPIGEKSGAQGGQNQQQTGAKGASDNVNQTPPPPPPKVEVPECEDVLKMVSSKDTKPKQALSALKKLMEREKNPQLLKLYQDYLDNPTEKTFQKLYRQAMRTYHPDHFKTNVDAASRVTSTYNVINDIIMKKLYNA